MSPRWALARTPSPGLGRPGRPPTPAGTARRAARTLDQGPARQLVSLDVITPPGPASSNGPYSGWMG